MSKHDTYRDQSKGGWIKQSQETTFKVTGINQKQVLMRSNKSTLPSLIIINNGLVGLQGFT